MQSVLKCEYNFHFFVIVLWIFVSCGCLSVHPELTVLFFMENLQDHRHVIIMSFYSTFCGLNLAAVHAEGKGQNHFQCILELREGRWDLLLAEFSLVKWHKCLGWYTWGSQYVYIGTWVMLKVMVYSAVIVVQIMMVVQKWLFWDYLLKTSETRQWSKEFYFRWIILRYISH